MKPILPRLGGAGRGRADEERALAARRTPSSARSAPVVVGCRVRHVHDRVDDGVELVRVLGRRRGRWRRPRGSRRDDEVVAARSRLDALGAVAAVWAVGVDSWPSMPKSALALSRPAAAPSLNDLSPRPVTSNSRPTRLAGAVGLGVAIGSTVPVPGLHAPVAAAAVVSPPAVVVVSPRPPSCRAPAAVVARRLRRVGCSAPLSLPQAAATNASTAMSESPLPSVASGACLLLRCPEYA